jgi:hypothetical protein
VLAHFRSGECGAGDGGSSKGSRDRATGAATVEARHLAGAAVGGSGPGMDLKGWAEKHNKINVLTEREREPARVIRSLHVSLRDFLHGLSLCNPRGVFPP